MVFSDLAPCKVILSVIWCLNVLDIRQERKGGGIPTYLKYSCERRDVVCFPFLTSLVLSTRDRFGAGSCEEGDADVAEPPWKPDHGGGRFCPAEGGPLPPQRISVDKPSGTRRLPQIFVNFL